MTRLQMREWTMFLMALALAGIGSEPSALAQANDPFGENKPAAPTKQRAPDTVMAAPADDSAMEVAIRKALQMPTNLEFIETPLQEAVDFLKDLHSIEI